VNKTVLAIILAVVIVVAVVWVVSSVGGKGKTGGVGSAPVEKTYSVKCTNPDCNFADPEMPETSYKALKANADEKGMMTCPQCGKQTLVDAAAAPSAPKGEEKK